MGILDNISGALNNPEMMQGLLSAGLGILANNTGNYGQLGPALGKGGLMGLQGYQQANELKRKKALEEAQVAHMAMQNEVLKAQIEEKKTKDQTLKELRGVLNPQPVVSSTVNMSNLPGMLSGDYQGMLTDNKFTTPPVDMQKAKALYAQLDPAHAMKEMFEKPKYHVVGNNLVPEPQNGEQVNPVFSGESQVLGKINPGEFTPQSLAKFAQSKNYSDLVPFDRANKQITNINAYTPASEEAQKKFMDKVATNWDNLKDAPVTLNNIEQAKGLVKKAGGFTGSGAEGKLAAAKFLNNNLNLNINVEGVASAEELRSRLFFGILDNLKKMDAQPTERQQAAMKEALGNIGTDPNALPRVLDAFADSIRGKVDTHNKSVKSAEDRGVKFPFDAYIQAPKKAMFPSDASVINRQPTNRPPLSSFGR